MERCGRKTSVPASNVLEKEVIIMFYPKYKSKNDIINHKRFIEYANNDDYELSKYKSARQKWRTRFMFSKTWVLCSWVNQENGKHEFVFSF